MVYTTVQGGYVSIIPTERALLGICIVSDKAREYALQKIAPDYFLAPSHQHIYQGIKELADTNLDELTLVGHLRTKGTLEESGGASFIMSLGSAFPSLNSYKSYCDLVFAEYGRRQATLAAAEITKAAEQASEIDTILENADALLSTIRNKVSLAKGEVGQHISLVQKTYEEWEQTQGIPFPFSDLNNIARGQHPGNVIMTGGYSADGKTWWGLQCAEEAASLKYKTAYITLEMPKMELYERLLIQYPNVTDADILSRNETEAIQRRKKYLLGYPLYMYDSDDGMDNIGAIEREVMRAYAEGDPYKYIVIDHMHLMNHGSADMRIAIGETMKRAKSLAVKYGVVIHFLGQLRRATDKGKNKFPMPTMADFRESSAIENIADFIMMVWRERDEEQQPMNTGKLIIAKVRRGQAPHPISITWKEDVCKFIVTPSLGTWRPVKTAWGAERPEETVVY